MAVTFDSRTWEFKDPTMVLNSKRKTDPARGGSWSYTATDNELLLGYDFVSEATRRMGKPMYTVDLVGDELTLYGGPTVGYVHYPPRASAVEPRDRCRRMGRLGPPIPS